MIYLDNSATTKVSKKAAEKATYMMTECFANPSSLHSFGFSAEMEIKNTKKALAAALYCREGEIYFTSGGTEANNTAIIGAAEANSRRGKKIVVSSIEHSSVLDAADCLYKKGFEIVRIAPDKNGVISPESVARAVDENTILVSVMLVNNEVGSIQDIATIAAAARRRNSSVLVHSDAVQGFGKIPVNVGKLGVDMLSVSAHKIGGPKGVGALFVKKGTKISPMIFGGEQQNRFRPGTENAPAIAAFGVALTQALESMPQNYKAVKELRENLADRLSKIENIEMNSPENALPYVVNFSTNAIKSETLIHFMEKKEIYVSGGSACAKGSRSHVLTAMGLSQKNIDTAVRVSFSHENTNADVDAFVNALNEALHTLQKLK